MEPQAGREKWQLSKEAFEGLLAIFDGDRDQAAERYEALRSRLIRFFMWERCPGAEDCADETINRVARRIAEGEVIANPLSYFHGVARRVALEQVQAFRRRSQALEQAGNVPFPEKDPSIEQAITCLESCLGRLEPDHRRFILEYYKGEGSGRIESRRKMAHALQLPVNAVRNRALRLREKIENCVRKCVSGSRDVSVLSHTLE